MKNSLQKHCLIVCNHFSKKMIKKICAVLFLMTVMVHHIDGEFCFSASLSTQLDCHDDICSKIPAMITNGAKASYFKCVQLFMGNTTSVDQQLCAQVSMAGCQQLSASYMANIYSYLGCSKLADTVCPTTFPSSAYSLSFSITIHILAFGFLLLNFQNFHQ